AGAADAEAIARVHVHSWQTTYKGLVPDLFLADLSVERRTMQWREALAQQQTNYLFVAETETEGTVGFVASGPEREGRRGYSGEIYAIYLLEQSQGQGIGRMLFETAMLDLKKRGHDSMLIWVLSGNPASGFYERMGGVFIAEKDIEIGGAVLQEMAYGWSKL
ncbi:MAG: GNAT family N-acetyltransferase, partial [Anaerolineales bacterium]